MRIIVGSCFVPIHHYYRVAGGGSSQVIIVVSSTKSGNKYNSLHNNKRLKRPISCLKDKGILALGV